MGEIRVKKGPKAESPQQVAQPRVCNNMVGQLMSGWQEPAQGQEPAKYTAADFHQFAAGAFANIKPDIFYEQLVAEYRKLNNDNEKKVFIQNATILFKEFVKLDILRDYEFENVTGLNKFISLGVNRKLNANESNEIKELFQKMDTECAKAVEQARADYDARNTLPQHTQKTKDDPRSIAQDLKKYATSIQGNISLKGLHTHYKQAEAPLSDYFNAITLKVGSEILTAPANERAKVFSKYLDIMDECIKIGDFSTAFAIQSGLTQNPVDRLRTQLSRKDGNRLQNAEELFSPMKNFGNLSKAIAAKSTSEVCLVPSALAGKYNEGASQVPKVTRVINQGQPDEIKVMNDMRSKMDGKAFLALIDAPSQIRNANTYNSNFVTELQNQPKVDGDLSASILYEQSLRVKPPNFVAESNTSFLPAGFSGGAQDLIDIMQKEQANQDAKKAAAPQAAAAAPEPARPRANTLDGVEPLRPDKGKEEEVVARPMMEPIERELGPNEKGKGRAPSPRNDDDPDVIPLRKHKHKTRKKEEPEASSSSSPAAPAKEVDWLREPISNQQYQLGRIRKTTPEQSSQQLLLSEAFKAANFNITDLQKIYISDAPGKPRCQIGFNSIEDADVIRAALDKAGIKFSTAAGVLTVSYSDLTKENIAKFTNSLQELTAHKQATDSKGKEEEAAPTSPVPGRVQQHFGADKLIPTSESQREKQELLEQAFDAIGLEIPRFDSVMLGMSLGEDVTKPRCRIMYDPDAPNLGEDINKALIKSGIDGYSNRGEIDVLYEDITREKVARFANNLLSIRDERARAEAPMQPVQPQQQAQPQVEAEQKARKLFTRKQAMAQLSSLSFNGEKVLSEQHLQNISQGLDKVQLNQIMEIFQQKAAGAFDGKINNEIVKNHSAELNALRGDDKKFTSKMQEYYLNEHRDDFKQQLQTAIQAYAQQAKAIEGMLVYARYNPELKKSLKSHLASANRNLAEMNQKLQNLDEYIKDTASKQDTNVTLYENIQSQIKKQTASKAPEVQPSAQNEVVAPSAAVPEAKPASLIDDTFAALVAAGEIQEPAQNLIDEVYDELVRRGDIPADQQSHQPPPPVPPISAIPDKFREAKERRVTIKELSSERKILQDALKAAGFENAPNVREVLRTEKIRGLSDSDYVERKSKFCGIYPKNPQDASDIKNALSAAGIAFEVRQTEKHGAYIKIQSKDLEKKPENFAAELGAKMRELKEQRIAPPAVPAAAPPPIPAEPHKHSPERQMLQKSLKIAFRHAPYVHDTKDGIHCAFHRRDEASIEALKKALKEANIDYVARETENHGIQFRIRHSQLKDKDPEMLGKLIKQVRHEQHVHREPPKAETKEAWDQAVQKATEKAVQADPPLPPVPPKEKEPPLPDIPDRPLPPLPEEEADPPLPPTPVQAAAEPSLAELEAKVVAAKQKEAESERKAAELAQRAAELAQKAKEAQARSAEAQAKLDKLGQREPAPPAPVKPAVASAATNPAGTLSSLLNSAPLQSTITVGDRGFEQRNRAVAQRVAEAGGPKQVKQEAKEAKQEKAPAPAFSAALEMFRKQERLAKEQNRDPTAPPVPPRIGGPGNKK